MSQRYLIKLQRQFLLSQWNESTAATTVAYLSSRRFADAHLITEAGSDPIVAGSRGSWLGNFTSFDMTKLRAKIRIAGKATGSVRVDLEVNTFGQQITQWNSTIWRLELIELHRVLRGLGRIDDIWSRFDRDYRSAAIRWTFTAMMGGQRLSKEWEAQLLELEEAFASAQGAA
jgi:hypothetical protein